MKNQSEDHSEGKLLKPLELYELLPLQNTQHFPGTLRCCNEWSSKYVSHLLDELVNGEVHALQFHRMESRNNHKIHDTANKTTESSSNERVDTTKKERLSMAKSNLPSSELIKCWLYLNYIVCDAVTKWYKITQNLFKIKCTSKWKTNNNPNKILQPVSLWARNERKEESNSDPKLLLFQLVLFSEMLLIHLLKCYSKGRIMLFGPAFLWHWIEQNSMPLCQCWFVTNCKGNSNGRIVTFNNLGS